MSEATSTIGIGVDAAAAVCEPVAGFDWGAEDPSRRAMCCTRPERHSGKAAKSRQTCADGGGWGGDGDGGEDHAGGLSDRSSRCWD